MKRLSGATLVAIALLLGSYGAATQPRIPRRSHHHAQKYTSTDQWAGMVKTLSKNWKAI